MADKPSNNPNTEQEKTAAMTAEENRVLLSQCCLLTAYLLSGDLQMDYEGYMIQRGYIKERTMPEVSAKKDSTGAPTVGDDKEEAAGSSRHETESSSTKNDASVSKTTM